MSDHAPWMSFADIISSAASALRDLGMDEVPPGTLKRWASDACRDFARRTHTARATFRTPMIQGQRLYRLPLECSRVTRVAIWVPGQGAPDELPALDEDEVMDASSQETEGYPGAFYLTEDRTQIGLYPMPSIGGFTGTVAAYVGGGTITLPTGASTSDDEYTGMTLKIQSGPNAGFESVISDYVGSTLVATLTTSVPAQTSADTRVVIGQDQLQIEYVCRGAEYRDQDQELSVVEAPTNNSVTAALPVRPYNHFKGFELFFTSGIGAGERVLVLSSSDTDSTGAVTTFTYFPELLSDPSEGNVGVKPAVLLTAPDPDTPGDSFELRQVPNVDPSFHHYLASYVTAMALRVVKNPIADRFMSEYENGVELAKQGDSPEEMVEFESIREFAKDEWEDW